MKRVVLGFVIPPKFFLNSNNMPNNFFVKSKIVKFLRELGAQTTLNAYPTSEDKNKALQYLDAREKETAYGVIKRREFKNEKKKLNVKTLSKDDIQRIENELEYLLPFIPSTELDMNFMFDVVSLNIIICPPTLRRFDPPNAYPTTKALIDGCVDAGILEDDNHKYLKNYNFQYGGVSPTPKNFTIYFELTKPDPNSKTQIIDITREKIIFKETE